MTAKIIGEYPPIERVPTGLWSLDRALGGGWAMTLYEVFGKKGVGKTTFSTSMAGIVSRELGKDIVYAPVEHVDRDLMQSILDSVSFQGSAYVLGGKDMMKEFLPEVKIGKDWHMTDEALGDCFVSALRRDHIGFGIFDSLTAVSPIEEMESSSAEKNMGRRARLSGVWARQILQSSRFREGGLCPTTIWLTHESTQMGGYPSNTGTSTTGGEAKKNLSKIRIKLRKLPEPTMSDLEDNAWVIEGVTEHNNFFREKLKFYVVVLGGKGIHVGLSALYDCKMLKIASFGKSVTLGNEKFGNIRTLIEKAHNGEDEVFKPFIDALKNPSKFDKATTDDEDEYIEEPAE